MPETVRYPWAHFETGSPYKHFARCTTCGTDIAFWHDSVIPRTARKKIDKHIADCYTPAHA